MTYVTDSTKSPAVNTGDITPGLVQRVANNAYHPNATVVNYPTKYDSLINKTNDQQTSVNVTDELHNSGAIDTSNSNRLFLQHRPRLGTSITFPGENVGVINTGLTDYNNGVIYWSTMPTGDPITVQYLADPDRYFGEYLNSIQDVVHQLQLLVGAGSAVNEGLKNAEFWVDSTTSAFADRAPNRIHVRNLEKDITLASDAGDLTGHTITIGNVADNVILGDDTGSFAQTKGILHCDLTGQSRDPLISDASVTSADTGLYDVLKCYGNVLIAGNLKVLGTETVVQTQFTSQVAIVQEDFAVRGHTYLGNNAGDAVIIAGDVTITGQVTQGTTGSKNLRIGNNLVMMNSGTNSGTVDGLDASYIANVHKYYRPGGPNWGQDCVNFGRMGTTIDTGSVARAGYSGTTTSAASNADELIDTGILGDFTGLASADNGFYYDSRCSDGTWFIRITSGGGAERGKVIRVDSVDTGNNLIKLSRALDTAAGSGVTYSLFNPYFCDGTWLTTTAPSTVNINASAGDPYVANSNGIVKVASANTALAGASSNAQYYLYMNLDGDADENTPQFHFNTGSGAPSDESTLIGEVEKSSSTFHPIVNYRPDLKFDSTWRYGGGGTYQVATTHTFIHNIGGTFRLSDLKIVIMNGGSGSTPASFTRPDPSSHAITALTATTITIAGLTAGDWWRIQISV
jgi:hypothetical protein